MYVATGDFICPACGAPCQPMRANYAVDNVPVYGAGRSIRTYTQGRAEGQVEFACQRGCRIEITTGFEPFMDAVHRSVGRRYQARRTGYEEIPYDDQIYRPEPVKAARPKKQPKPVDEPFPEWPELEERKP